jgi:NADH-quinone oxidoreductase subunit G/NADP-reducing hydrogenase subunit HndD
MEIRLEVNGTEIIAEKGETILNALNRNGMHVPTICNLKELSPTGACRMCVVEVEGFENLVPACSFPVEESLRIRTHSPRVLRARKANVELLLASHPDDCLYCERNGFCELQSLAGELNIRERRIPGRRSFHRTDRSSPAIVRDPSKCILCGRCVRICEEVMATSTLDFAGRGNELEISTSMAMAMDDSNCTACGQCLNACPTGALVENIQFPELEPLMDDPGTGVMVQLTPAVTVSLGELLGYRPGTDLSQAIPAILKRLGFDFVVENSLGADVMILEQAAVFRERKGQGQPFPLITSSCPAWVQFCRMNYPELIPHLSPLRSPAGITGTLMKTRFAGQIKNGKKSLVSVLVTSCTADKREAKRSAPGPGEDPAIDFVLTTREVAKMIRLSGLDLEKLPSGDNGIPGMVAGTAGRLTAVAGGEAECTVRSIFHRETGREMDPSKLQRFRIRKAFREAVVDTSGSPLRIGAVSGLSEAAAVIEGIRAGRIQLDLLEVMACPEGCINGGGQPLRAGEDTVRSRTRAVYEMDNSAEVRTAYYNPEAGRLYEDFLGEPGGKESRKLFFST